MSDPRAANNSSVEPPPRRRRWLGPALFMSLALNLLGLGIVAGAFLGQGGAPGGRLPEASGMPSWFAGLDARDRAALRVAWRREGPGRAALRAQRREQSAALVAAIRAEPFDPAALEVALVRQAAGLAERQALAQRLLVERLTAMDAAGRAAFADRLEAGLQRRSVRPDHMDNHAGPARPDRPRD